MTGNDKKEGRKVMNQMKIESIKDRIPLNNGMSIPQLGFGCFQLADEEIEQVIQWQQRQATVTLMQLPGMKMKKGWEEG